MLTGRGAGHSPAPAVADLAELPDIDMDQLTRRGAGGIEADHATVFRWVVRFTPLFAEAARPGRHTPGGRWFVDETYVKVLGRWRYLYRAVDQFGQVIDVLVSPKRDQKAARRFFTRALAELHPAGRSNQRPGPPPTPRVLDEFLPAAQHVTVPYANNRVEARPRPAQGTATTHAGPETGPLVADRRGRACVRAEPAARPLRTRDRSGATRPRGRRVHRTRARHLTDLARQPLPPAPPPSNATAPGGVRHAHTPAAGSGGAVAGVRPGRICGRLGSSRRWK